EGAFSGRAIQLIGCRTKNVGNGDLIQYSLKLIQVHSIPLVFWLYSDHNDFMRKRSRKKERMPDPNKLAFSIVQAIAGEPAAAQPAQEKDPIAVELGRRGGLKGGKARAAKMTKKQRIASAKKAASARWRSKT